MFGWRIGYTKTKQKNTERSAQENCVNLLTWLVSMPNRLEL